MSKPNFFADVDALNCLLGMDYDAQALPAMDLTVDLLDLPFWFSLKSDEKSRTLSLYTQMELYTKNEELATARGSVVLDDETGKAQVSAPQNFGDNMVAFYMACRNLSLFAKEKGLDTLWADADPEQSGILLMEKDGSLSWQLVSGMDRPELTVERMFGGTMKMRPYMDDFWDRSETEMMSLEDRIEKAENGDRFAMATLAQAYLNGDDEVEQDPAQAAYWYRKEAEQGDSEGAFNLGLLYAKGFGVERDFEQAAEWMEKALAWGDSDAPALAKQYRDMAENLRKAEAGDAEAMAEVAGGYMTLGNSLDQAGPGDDYNQSLYWAQKAVDAGCAAGYWPLALAWEHGRGVEKDDKKAVEFYRIGAELGNAPCQHSYGCRLMTGEGAAVDKKLAFEFFKRSAERGYGLAMRDLGRCYQFADGCTGNMQTAVEWYEKALEVIDDPELARKTALFKQLSGSDPNWSEDYEGDTGAPADTDPVPDYEFNLTNTKKGDRKARSEKVNVGDAVSFVMNETGSRINAVTHAGDIGDVAADSWLNKLNEKQIPYEAEVIEAVPYSKLENKRCNPVIKVRLHLNVTCGELKKRLGWQFIPGGIYGDGTLNFGWLEDAPSTGEGNSQKNEIEQSSPETELVVDVSRENAPGYEAPTEADNASKKEETSAEADMADVNPSKIIPDDPSYYDAHLHFQLPEGYAIERGVNADGNTYYQILYHVSTNENGEKSAEMKMEIRPQDASALDASKFNLSGSMSCALKSSVSETKVAIFTFQVLIAVAVFKQGDHAYALVSNRFARNQEALEQEANTMAEHMNTILGCMEIDGVQGSFEAITGERLLAGGTSVEENQFPKATPGEEQHSQLDFQNDARDRLGILGGLVQLNQTGTEFAFEPLSRFSGADDSVEAILKNACELDTGGFSLAEKAREMARLFRVNLDAFDGEHDREQEIENGMIQRAVTYNLFRSFAWTLSAYCSENNTEPGTLAYEKLQSMLQFISRRKGLNYREDVYCPTLCGGNDIHVYYLPDALGQQERETLLTAANQDAEGLAQICSTMSLEGLRRDLEYLYPAMKTIHDKLSEMRDRSTALTGNEADVLYAWCAMTYAAREPIFSEDGPVNNWFEHPDQQAVWDAQWRLEQEKREKQAAVDWMKAYGENVTHDPDIRFPDSRFVFAGVEGSDEWPEILEKLAAKSGIYRTGVSGKTDYLVCDPRRAGDSKVRAVREQKRKGKTIEIILLDDFLKALGMETTTAENAEESELIPEVPPVREDHSTYSQVEQQKDEAEPFTLCYKQGLKAGGEDYEIDIPDGFVIRQGLEDRDFIAWLPNSENSEEYRDARVVIMAGQNSMPEAAAQFCIADEYEALAHAMYFGALGTISKMFEKVFYLPYLRSDLPGGFSISYDSGCVHANATLAVADHIKSMRLQFLDISDTDRDKITAMVPQIFEHMRAFRAVAQMTEPGDTSFAQRALDRTCVDDWLKCKDELIRHLAIARMIVQKSIVSDYQNRDDVTVSELFEALRVLLTGISEATEKRLKQSHQLFKTLSTANPGNNLLLEIRDGLCELAEFAEQSITVDGELIKAESAYAKQLLENPDTPETLAIKREEERNKKEETARKVEETRLAVEERRKEKESERKAAEERKKMEEAERKAAEERRKEQQREEIRKRRAAEETRASFPQRASDWVKKVKDVQEQREKRLDELGDEAYRTALRKLDQESTDLKEQMTRFRKEKAETQTALDALGFFQFSEKKPLKEKMKDLESQISQLDERQRKVAEKRAETEKSPYSIKVKARESAKAQIEAEIPMPALIDSRGEPVDFDGLKKEFFKEALTLETLSNLTLYYSQFPKEFIRFVMNELVKEGKLIRTCHRMDEYYSEP